MPDDMPTYLWGDTISLRMEIEHEVNMTDVWAIFRKQGDTFEFRLKLRESYNLRLMEWQGRGGSARWSWKPRWTGPTSS